MTLPFTFLFAFSFHLSASAQQSVLDIPEMYQLIDESHAEHKLQVDAKNQQTTNTANEQVNLTLLGKVKAMYRTLQQRYNTLGTVINLAEIGMYATPMIKQIVNYQGQIVSLVQKDPAVAFLGYQTEIEFVEKAEALGGYVAGLLLSLGDINQMKASDRKLLFDYVVQQLSRIQELSGNMLRLLQYKNLSAVLRALNPFATWISQDKSMVNSILNNAKYLK
ncbi:MAG: hypothetical protein JSU01_23910 [Bacteroidetes bacterium]|nr:hypothetical protein [Bacteroidota bacterium]